jgi:nitroimidazol reductase NimA-like FMN-containing flavoprotein (pyridoxamine 5'-phosphate oxidase superfamily)
MEDDLDIRGFERRAEPDHTGELHTVMGRRSLSLPRMRPDNHRSGIRGGEMDDGDALEVLTEDECRELLGVGRVGRVGVTVGALPVILPVNYGWVNGEVLFRTGTGTKLRAAVEKAVIAFEVDSYDEDARSGWSVLAVGRAYQLADSDAVVAAEQLGLAPWADGSRHEWVGMRPEFISGRRIEARDTPQ